MKANKILYLGNSITLHGPKADIGWSGNWGMAATAQSKDYVHTLTTAIDAVTGADLTLDRAGDGGVDNIINIADIFERNYSTYDNSRLQTQINYKPDIVVLQFGENLAPVSTEADKAVFKSRLETMLSALKNSSNPNIFVTSYIIGANPMVDALKQEVCAADPTRRFFVDLNGFRNDGTNYASAEGHFSNPGVAGHPGDKGMKYIADNIFAAMEARAVATPEPSCCALLATGALALAAFAWRKHK
jgi:alpha-galactosidase